MLKFRKNKLLLYIQYIVGLRQVRQCRKDYVYYRPQKKEALL